MRQCGGVRIGQRGPAGGREGRREDGARRREEAAGGEAHLAELVRAADNHDVLQAPPEREAVAELGEEHVPAVRGEDEARADAVPAGRSRQPVDDAGRGAVLDEIVQHVRDADERAWAGGGAGRQHRLVQPARNDDDVSCEKLSCVLCAPNWSCCSMHCKKCCRTGSGSGDFRCDCIRASSSRSSVAFVTREDTSLDSGALRRSSSASLQLSMPNLSETTRLLLGAANNMAHLSPRLCNKVSLRQDQ